VFGDAELGKISPVCQHNSPQAQIAANRRFEFHKRSQLFICVHDETPSVGAMRVNNPDRLPVGIDR
jgi:hypothetical protein